MNKARIVVALVLAGFFLGVGAFTGQAGEGEKQIVPEADIKAHQVIRLHYVGGITPAEVTIAPGTTVIWMNDSRAPLEIQFGGKQVTLACKRPVHFAIDENGSFISDRIPQGSVASLCFVEKGDFTYVARKAYAGSGIPDRQNIKEFKGTIRVQ